MRPLQSSSLPLQVSAAVGNTGHMYSHLLAPFLSRSTKPGWHAPIEQAPAVQTPNALAYEHTVPHLPQLFGSMSSVACGTSSTRLLQSLSMPSQISRPLLVGTHGPSLWPVR